MRTRSSWVIACATLLPLTGCQESWSDDGCPAAAPLHPGWPTFSGSTAATEFPDDGLSVLAAPVSCDGALVADGASSLTAEESSLAVPQDLCFAPVNGGEPFSTRVLLPPGFSLTVPDPVFVTFGPSLGENRGSQFLLLEAESTEEPLLLITQAEVDAPTQELLVKAVLPSGACDAVWQPPRDSTTRLPGFGHRGSARLRLGDLNVEVPVGGATVVSGELLAGRVAFETSSAAPQWTLEDRPFVFSVGYVADAVRAD